jgi:hypothetical protein
LYFLLKELKEINLGISFVKGFIYLALADRQEFFKKHLIKKDIIWENK